MALKTLENVTVSDAYLALMADRGVEYCSPTPAPTSRR